MHTGSDLISFLYFQTIETGDIYDLSVSAISHFNFLLVPVLCVTVLHTELGQLFLVCQKPKPLCARTKKLHKICFNFSDEIPCLKLFMQALRKSAQITTVITNVRTIITTYVSTIILITWRSGVDRLECLDLKILNYGINLGKGVHMHHRLVWYWMQMRTNEWHINANQFNREIANFGDSFLINQIDNIDVFSQSK